MSWRDLAIDLASLDSKILLSSWAWLFQGRDLTPLAMTSFGDWFLKDTTGTIHFLDLVAGELRPIADSAAEFERKASLQENLEDWFLSGLVLLLRERGVLLKAGECYGFKLPPMIGGKVEVDNIEPTMHGVHQAIQAQLHEQTSRLPPGTRISGFDVKGE